MSGGDRRISEPSTVAPVKWKVGRRSFPFGMAYFQGRFVSFREGNGCFQVGEPVSKL